MALIKYKNNKTGEWKSIPVIKGNKGEDGTSVTIQSVNESTVDGGNNIVTFSDGKTMTIKNGNKGDTYILTSSDKAEIVNAVIDALPIYNGEVI